MTFETYEREYDEAEQVDFFYSSLEQQWRDESTGNLVFPDDVYSDRKSLLRLSDNRADWHIHGPSDKYADAKLSGVRSVFSQVCVEWVMAQRKRPSNLAFIGQNGTGKTWSAIACARFMCLHGVRDANKSLYLPTVRVLKCVDIHNLLDGWSKNQDAHSVVEKFKKTPLLVVDDLGAVATTAQSAISNLCSIISERYDMDLPSIFTANVQPDQLSKIYGSTIARRIFDENVLVHSS